MVSCCCVCVFNDLKLKRLVRVCRTVIVTVLLFKWNYEWYRNNTGCDRKGWIKYEGVDKSNPEPKITHVTVTDALEIVLCCIE